MDSHHGQCFFLRVRLVGAVKIALRSRQLDHVVVDILNWRWLVILVAASQLFDFYLSSSHTTNSGNSLELLLRSLTRRLRRMMLEVFLRAVEYAAAARITRTASSKLVAFICPDAHRMTSRRWSDWARSSATRRAASSLMASSDVMRANSSSLALCRTSC
jgi:hypothetical protein